MNSTITLTSSCDQVVASSSQPCLFACIISMYFICLLLHGYRRPGSRRSSATSEPIPASRHRARAPHHRQLSNPSVIRVVAGSSWNDLLGRTDVLGEPVGHEVQSRADSGVNTYGVVVVTAT